MTENELDLLRALEIEAREEFEAAQRRSRQRRAELGITSKMTAPGVGPQERHELLKLAREVDRAGTTWRNRVRARERGEHELAVACVRAASNLDEIEALDAEIAEQMPLSYRSEIGGRVFELRQKRAAMMAEFDAALEAEKENYRCDVTQTKSTRKSGA